MDVVVVVSPALLHWAVPLTEMLREAGLNAKQQLLGPDCSSLSNLKDDTVIVAPSYFDEAASHRSNLLEAFEAPRPRWCRAVIGRAHNRFQVGPLFGPSQKACTYCTDRVAIPFREESLSIPRSLALRAFGAWVASWLKLRAEDSRPTCFDDFDLCTGIARRRIVAASRCCPVCFHAPTNSSLVSTYRKMVETFHDLNRLRDKEIYPDTDFPRGRAAHAGGVSLPIPYTASSSSLPPKPRLWPSRTSPNHTLRIDHIGFLLRVGTGRKATARSNSIGGRWCPSAGNLASVSLSCELHKISGVMDADYLYESEEHTLQLVRPLGERSSRPPAFPPGWNRAEEQPCALLRISGSLDRLSEKYGTFATRLVYLDIGTAAAQLLWSAHALGLSVGFKLTVSCVRRETVSGGLRMGATLFLSGMPALRELPELAEDGPRPDLEYVEDQTDCAAIERYLLQEERMRISTRNAADRYLIGSMPPHSLRMCGRPEAKALSSRSSCRSFADAATSKKDLEVILSKSLAFMESHVEPQFMDYTDLRLYVRNVSGLKAGTYNCKAGDTALALVPTYTYDLQVPRNTSFCVYVVLHTPLLDSKQIIYNEQLIIAGMFCHIIGLNATTQGLDGYLSAGVTLVDVRMCPSDELTLFSYIAGVAQRGPSCP